MRTVLQNLNTSWTQAGRNIAWLTAVLGFVAFAASWLLLSIHGETYTTCADGWASPSIGESGACSWHGREVEMTRDVRSRSQKNVCHYLLISGTSLLALASVVGAWTFAADRKRENEENERRRKWLASLVNELEEDLAVVPLTIAGETRRVSVHKIAEGIYDTGLEVAVMRSFDGRVNDRSSAIKFYKRGSEYVPDLNRPISIGPNDYRAYAYG